jgi:hypothetical protein
VLIRGAAAHRNFETVTDIKRFCKRQIGQNQHADHGSDLFHVDSLQHSNTPWLPTRVIIPLHTAMKRYAVLAWLISLVRRITDSNPHVNRASMGYNGIQVRNDCANYGSKSRFDVFWEVK